MYSLISLSIVASEQSKYTVHSKDLEIKKVIVMVGKVKLERPVTPVRTMNDEPLTQTCQVQTKQGPIRKSSYTLDRVQDAIQTDEFRLLLEKMRRDLFEIERQKYLQALQQAMQANIIASTGAASAGMPSENTSGRNFSRCMFGFV